MQEFKASPHLARMEVVKLRGEDCVEQIGIRRDEHFHGALVQAVRLAVLLASLSFRWAYCRKLSRREQKILTVP